jgi:glucose/arabinose dehydrogenase
MKPLPILSISLFATLSAGALVMNSCGDDGGGDSVVIDATPPDDAAPLHCDVVSGSALALEEVASGLTAPLFVDAPKGDDRLFIVEQPGTIMVLKDGALLPTPFLDVENIVNETGNEQGLLGLAFHPDYASNGRFFINYTGAPSGATVVAEYTASANADVANGTGKILLSFNQPYSNHNGGMLAFGPDGYLYIGTGDGGSRDDPQGNAQNLDSHLGKLLRIDVDGGDPYGIPADNPYVDGGGLAEIWAYCLRNPWRFSFDQMTGDIYIADVGQDAWEEVSVQPATAANLNYGWKVMEGKQCFSPSVGCDTSGKVEPVHDYQHIGGGRSVTGGYVYRGQCLLDIKGRYFFGDYETEEFFTFDSNTGANLQEITDQIDPNGEINGLSSFGTDGYGEMYVVSRAGKVFRIVVSP